MSDRSQDFTRRDFLRTGLAAGALIPVAGLVLGAHPALAAEEKVTESATLAPMVQALQYKAVSDKPDQHCANCQFFTPTSGGFGKCQLFISGAVQGIVSDKGWCMSWAKKVA